MPVGQESLLGNTPEQAQCRKHLTWRRICLVVVGLAVAFVGITATYMYSIGALDFSKVRRDLAFNGSHVFEPETHVAFPVQLHTLFNGEKRIQRIFGVSLKTVEHLGSNVRINVQALYIDRSIVRKRFASYKSGVPPFSKDKSSPFTTFMSSLVGSGVTITFKYHQLFDGCSARMYTDNTFHAMGPYLMTYPNMTEEHYESIHDALNSWYLGDGSIVHHGLEYALQWDGDQGTFMHSAKIMQPVVHDEAFRQAWLLLEFEYKFDKFEWDLWSTLFDPSWDDL